MAITVTAIRNHKIVFFKVLGKMGTNFLWLGKDKSLNFLKSLPRGVKMFGEMCYSFLLRRSVHITIFKVTKIN